jgi:hypothetical protein
MLYTAQGKVKKMVIQKSKKQIALKRRADRDRVAYLDTLIDKAVVDCYNESEQITGLFTLLEENLTLPFATTLLGVEVIVERVDMNDADEIVVVCRRGRERQRIPILDLPLPEPKPQGAEWVEAFRRWAGGR